MNQISIEKRIIDNQEFTAICIGEVSGELPRHLLSGTQEPGYIYRNGLLTPLYYTAVRDIEGKRYLFYENIDILPFKEIAHSLKEEGKERILCLSKAFQTVKNDFLMSESGLIPTWRIFWLSGEGVLLLPDRISSLILYSASDEERDEHIYRYMKPNLLPPFALTHQLTQILYYSATGITPYEKKESKELKWTHIPLSLGFTNLDKRTCDAIDKILNMSLVDQRENFSGAYSTSENLSYFDSLFTPLPWDVKNEDPLFEESVVNSIPLHEYVTKFNKKAQQRAFFRKKGAAILVASAAVVIILLTLMQLIINANKAPYTSGMSPQEVVSEFFVGQNELDIEKMNASLQRGVKNPFENEVSSLFVNSRIRQAYEGIKSIISPSEYNAQEEKSIQESTIIYGVDNLMFDKQNENTILVTYDYYAPGVLAEGEAGYHLQVIQKVVKFTLNNTKGYERIENIEIISEKIIKDEIIQTYSK